MSNNRIGVRALKTHCTFGHLLDGENVRLYEDHRGVTRRICRTCARRRLQMARTYDASAPVAPRKQWVRHDDRIEKWRAQMERISGWSMAMAEAAKAYRRVCDA